MIKEKVYYLRDDIDKKISEHIRDYEHSRDGRDY